MGDERPVEVGTATPDMKWAYQGDRSPTGVATYSWVMRREIGDSEPHWKTADEALAYARRRWNCTG